MYCYYNKCSKKIYKNLDDRLTSILLSDRHTILFFGKLSND